VLDAALDGRIELVSSPSLLAEITSVLARERLRRYLSLDEAERFVADLASQTALSTDAPRPHPAICRDAGDDYLIALALHAGAEAIITGDRDLLEIADPPVRPGTLPSCPICRSSRSAGTSPNTTGQHQTPEPGGRRW
jgi:uncharacterized protein